MFDEGRRLAKGTGCADVHDVIASLSFVLQVFIKIKCILTMKNNWQSTFDAKLFRSCTNQCPYYSYRKDKVF